MISEKRKEGFAGEASVVLPDAIIKIIKDNPLVSSLFITDIGFYPHAQYHHIEREAGAAAHILIYVVEGSGVIELEGVKYRLDKNHFFIIPAKQQHRYWSDPKEVWSIYWLHFSGTNSKLFSKLFSDIQQISPSPIARIHDRIQLFNEIIEILQMGYSMDNIEYANLCLYQLLASFKYIDQYRAKNLVKNDPIQKSIRFMRDHLHLSLELQTLAHEAGLSVSHYSALFKQKTRQSPIDYFIQLKIQYACQLIDLNNLSIRQVSEAIGYTDSFYFSRIFKKVMGVSPSEYRKRDIK